MMNFHFQWLLLSIFSAFQVQSLPYIIITSSQQKCISIEVAKASTIGIAYDAPNLVKLPEDDSSVHYDAIGRSNRDIPDSRSSGYGGYGGYSVRESAARHDQYRRDMDLMGSRGGDLRHVAASHSNTMNEIVDCRILVRNDGKSKVFQLKKARGEERYRLSNDADTSSEICIQCLSASNASPSMISIHIDLVNTEYEEEISRMKHEQSMNQKRFESHQETANEHFRSMEKDIYRLITEVTTFRDMGSQRRLLHDKLYDQSKDLERVIYRTKRIQIFILFVMSIVHIRHVLGHLKKRRVI